MASLPAPPSAQPRLPLLQFTPAVQTLKSNFLHNRAVENVPPDQMEFISGSTCHSCSVVAVCGLPSQSLFHATPAVSSQCVGLPRNLHCDLLLAVATTQSSLVVFLSPLPPLTGGLSASLMTSHCHDMLPPFLGGLPDMQTPVTSCWTYLA